MSFFSWDCVEGHYWTHDEAMQTAFFFFFFFNQFASLSLQPRGYNPGYDNMTMTGSVANAPGVLCDS